MSFTPQPRVPLGPRTPGNQGPGERSVTRSRETKLGFACNGDEGPAGAVPRVSLEHVCSAPCACTMPALPPQGDCRLIPGGLELGADVKEAWVLQAGQCSRPRAFLTL